MVGDSAIELSEEPVVVAVNFGISLGAAWLLTLCDLLVQVRTLTGEESALGYVGKLNVRGEVKAEGKAAGKAAGKAEAGDPLISLGSKEIVLSSTDTSTLRLLGEVDGEDLASIDPVICALGEGVRPIFV